MTSQLQSLHACWCSLTGQEINYRATERIFWELHNNDFTEDDLRCVLKHVLAYNRTHPGAQMKVQLHKLCADLAVFASICAEAKAKERNRVKPPTPREVVLHEFRGVTPEANGNGRHVSEIFEKMRKATE